MPSCRMQRHARPQVLLILLAISGLEFLPYLERKLWLAARYALDRVQVQLAPKARLGGECLFLQHALGILVNPIEILESGCIDLRQTLRNRLGYGNLAFAEREADAFPDVIHRQRAERDHVVEQGVTVIRLQFG